VPDVRILEERSSIHFEPDVDATAPAPAEAVPPAAAIDARSRDNARTRDRESR